MEDTISYEALEDIEVTWHKQYRTAYDGNEVCLSETMQGRIEVREYFNTLEAGRAAKAQLANVVKVREYIERTMIEQGYPVVFVVHTTK